VHEKYQQGFFVKDKGAIGIDLSPWKLGFAMFLKSDGNGLYLTKDLDLIVKKFSDPQVTKSIYIVDSRQKLHFQQLFKTAELMGYPQAKKSLHLSYETVNTQEGKPFSSRQLNGLQLEDLKNKMEERVISHYLERYQGQWSPKEILGTAQDIAKGALKYGMLCVDHNTQIRFSLEEWLRLDGDTGPYLQYVHARCCRILEKQGKPSQKTEFQVQEHSEEQLLCALVHFRVVVKHSAKQYRPCVLARYLHDLAKTFNQFYEQCPIQILPAGVMKESRLALVWGTQKIIQRGLCLLGIPAPEKM
jgi:arginyl-tRNA synthetase